MVHLNETKIWTCVSVCMSVYLSVCCPCLVCSLFLQRLACCQDSQKGSWQDFQMDGMINRRTDGRKDRWNSNSNFLAALWSFTYFFWYNGFKQYKKVWKSFNFECSCLICSNSLKFCIAEIIKFTSLQQLFLSFEIFVQNNIFVDHNF